LQTATDAAPLAEGQVAISTGALLNAAAGCETAVATQLVAAGAVTSLLWLLENASGADEVAVAVRCLVELAEVSRPVRLELELCVQYYVSYYAVYMLRFHRHAMRFALELSPEP